MSDSKAVYTIVNTTIIAVHKLSNVFLCAVMQPEGRDQLSGE